MEELRQQSRPSEAVVQRPAQNRIRVNLHSPPVEGRFDNRASVEVECERPDEVVDRMLTKLADRFPPPSVMTVQRDPALPSHHNQVAVVPRPEMVPSTIPGHHGPLYIDVPNQMYGVQGYEANVHRRSYYSEMPTENEVIRTWDHSKTVATVIPTTTEIITDASIGFSGQTEYRIDEITGARYEIRYIKKMVSKTVKKIEEKIVPRWEVQYVEKVVEVPEVQLMEILYEVPEVIVEKIEIPIPVVEVRTAYIEVPTVEVVDVVIPNKQVIEKVIEHKKPMIEYVEKFVDVPIDKWIDIPQEYVVEEVIPRTVRKVEKQYRQIEIPVHISKAITIPVEKVVEIAKVVEVPKPQVIEVPVPYTTFKDTPWPVVVAQKLIPVVVNECYEEVEVEVKNYVPYIVPVDVYVPRVVQLPYIRGRQQMQQHVVTGIPVPHWNGLVHRLNTHLISDAYLQAYTPLLKEADGTVPVAHHPPLVRPFVTVDQISGYYQFLEYLQRFQVIVNGHHGYHRSIQ